jgi:hypothetical protein
MKNTKKSKKVHQSLDLSELSNKANQYHEKVTRAWRGALSYARRCGKTLNKAKKVVGHGSWEKWLRDNFDASYETAVNYMRIARNLENPLLIEAREKGITLDSIKSILKVLKGEQPEDKDTKQLTEADYARKTIKKKFSEKLQDELSDDDLMIFARDDIFECLWDKLYAKLRDVVSEDV